MSSGPAMIAAPATGGFAPFPPKFARPPVAPNVVARRDLVDRLVAFTGREILITAPAGYGKTTLTAQWSAIDPRPFAWLSIDPADDNPFVLLSYLASTLDGLVRVLPADLDAVTSADVDLGVATSALARTLAAATEPFVLVLDDVHHLGGPGAESVLATLADHIPPGCVLTLLTRGASPIPASRAALHGDALVIEPTDLAMTSDEAARLLAASGVSVSERVALRLWETTEGWPAGLYLAALALRGSTDIDAAVDDFAGNRREVTDFFAEEVLHALPAGDTDFMLSTAVLERLSGPLCDAVLETAATGARLERLSRENRFVVPLDDTGEWYRYHHLFREMLVTEARRRDADRCRAVARRASRWFLEHEDLETAVSHAFAADDRDETAALVWSVAAVMQNTRRVATVQQWLARFSPDELLTKPTLAVTAAWTALTAGQPEDVYRFTTAVELLGDTTPLPDGTPPSAAAALLRAMTTSSGLSVMRDNAAAAFAGHPPRSPYRAIARFLEAFALAIAGELSDARERATEGIELARVLLPSAGAHSLAAIARVAISEGHWAEARHAVDDALAVLEEFGFEDRPAMCAVYSVAAVAHLHDGLRDRGDSERRHARALADRMDDVSPFLVAAVQLDLADAAVAADDLPTARAHLDEAERRLRRLRDTGTLPATFERLRSGLAEAEARVGVELVERLTPAELRVLEHLPTHLTFGEIGEVLFLSRNTVKTHAMAIYRKLGVTSRSGAVDEARTLRLLGDGRPPFTQAG